MSRLKEEYERYVEEERKYEKEKAILDSKIQDLSKKIKEKSGELNTELLNSLGIDFSVKLSNLSDEKYLKELSNNISEVLEKLEEVGTKMLKDSGYVNNN